MGLFDNIFKELNTDTKSKEYKLLNKQKDIQSGKFQFFETGVCQADLIYMPHYGGYKFILTVIDGYTKKADAEPVRERDAESVKKAFEKVFKRKFVSQNIKYLYLDGGSEFKGEFADYCDSKNIKVRIGMPYRKQQTALVESLNHVFTKVLMTNINIQELKNSTVSYNWPKAIPTIVKTLNQRDDKERKVKKINDFFDDPHIGKKDKLLKVGQYVYYHHQVPRDIRDGKVLAYGGGKFRNGDLRFNHKDAKKIVQVAIYSGQPVRYILEGMNNVSFLRSQLILADDIPQQQQQQPQPVPVQQPPPPPPQRPQRVDPNESLPEQPLPPPQEATRERAQYTMQLRERPQKNKQYPHMNIG